MTVLEVFEASKSFSLAGSALIALACLLHYKRRNLYIRTLGFYAAISILFSIAQILSSTLFSHKGLNEIGNIFTLLEVWLFALLFYYALRESRLRKSVLIIAGFYSLFYALVFVIFIDNSFSLIRFGRDFLMILYSIGYFYYLIRKLPEERLVRFPMFWINAAIIFFFSGTLILSLMRDYLVSILKDDMAGFWAFRNFFRFGFCLVLAYAGWLDLQRIKKITHN